MRLLVASFALTSCLVIAVASAEARSCVRTEVSSAPARLPGSTSGPHARRFSATKILDLTFTVLLPVRTAGDHLVDLRLFTPDGQLYRSLAVPVAAPGRACLDRSITGYPRPMRQRPSARAARGRDHFRAVSTTFPVAGTDIVSSALYGRWRVETYLDGAEQSCAPAVWFTLNP